MEKKIREPDFNKYIDMVAFLYKHFGACGCSELNEIVNVLKYLLEWSAIDIDSRSAYNKLNIDVGYYYIIIGLLDQLDMLEHGCAIRVPWITEKGKQFLKGLRIFKEDEEKREPEEAYDGVYYS